MTSDSERYIAPAVDHFRVGTAFAIALENDDLKEMCYHYTARNSTKRQASRDYVSRTKSFQLWSGLEVITHEPAYASTLMQNRAQSRQRSPGG
jgi:hypothetical protein